MYWPNWNNDVETTWQTCDLCRENQSMPANIPNSRSKPIILEKSMVLTFTDIQGKPHIILADYYTCYIYE